MEDFICMYSTLTFVTKVQQNKLQSRNSIDMGHAFLRGLQWAGLIKNPTYVNQSGWRSIVNVFLC